MEVGGWVVAAVLSEFGGQGCCTVAVSFSKGQKECFPVEPLGSGHNLVKMWRGDI